MRTCTLRSWTFVAALLLVGCSATGPLYQQAAPPESGELSIVNIYRPDRFLSGGVSYRLFIDDKKLVNLKNNGYSRVLVPPGRHTLRVAVFNFVGFLPIGLVFSSALSFQANAGKRHFLRVRPGFFFCTLSEVPEQVAITEISTSRFVDPNLSRL